jgi:hypothetical protein
MSEPTPQRSTHGLPFVARIVAGVLLVAVLVGVGLWAERLTDDDLALPDEVGGEALNDTAAGDELAEVNATALSEAYDGADAVAALYGKDSEAGVLVTAVRAGSGPLVPPVHSGSEHWAEDDEVTCLVTPAPEGPGVTQCQRDDHDLTVRLVVRGRPELDPLVEAVNEVWEDLS